MDLAFLYQGQRFVWDVDKAAANVAKHGVSFERRAKSSLIRSFGLKMSAQKLSGEMQ